SGLHHRLPGEQRAQFRRVDPPVGQAQPLPDRDLVGGEDRLAQLLLQGRDVRRRVQGRVREEHRLHVRTVGRAGQRQHLRLGPGADLRRRDDARADDVGHLDAGGAEEVPEEPRHVVGIGRADRDPPHPQLLRRVHEGEGGGRGRHGRLGQGPHLCVGAVPAVHEAAAGAGPHHGVGAGQPQLGHPRLQPPRRAHLE
nr:hypothetical protein - Streptomyces lividans [Streptomyces lividans]